MIWLIVALALAMLPMAVAVVALWIGLSRLRRRIQALRDDQQRQITSLLALHGALKAIADDVIAHEQMQNGIRRALERLSDQHSELRLRDAEEGAYAQAIQLIARGRSREEVRALCALTATELDLLFTLHGQGLGARPERAAPTGPDARA